MVRCKKRMGYVYVYVHSHSLLVCGMLGLVIRKGKKRRKKVVMRMIACLVVVDPKRE